MSLFKKTIFWVMVLAVIAGVFIVFTKEEEKSEKKREESARLFLFEPDDVTDISFKKGDRIIECKNDGKGWYILKPVRADADKDAFERFFKMVVKGKIDAVLFENQPKDRLSEFGLDKPYLEVSFKLKNEKKLKSIFFGDRGPTQNVAFAITSDDSRVLRLHADVRAEADKDVYDLRDKTILPFEPTKAKGVAIIRGDKKIVMEQPSEGMWHLTEPFEGIVNVAKLMEILYKVKNSKAQAFIEEDPKDLKKYGLDKPIIKLNVWSGDANPPQVLLIGDKSKNPRGIYAKRESIANVFLLEEEFIDIFPEDAKKMVEKQ
ncbi:MAG: DUF4340 domain-containing protein [Nitrospirota bacterium]